MLGARAMVLSVVPAVRPFPWGELPRVAASEAAASARLRSAVAARIDGAATSVLASMLNAAVAVRLAFPRAHTPLGDGAVGLLLAEAGDARASARLLLAVEGPLALAVVARALGGKAPMVADATRAASAPVAGALGAIVTAAARRAARARLVVVAAGPEADLARDLAAHTASVARVALSVTIDGETFRASIAGDAAAWSPVSSPRSPSALPAVARERLAALGLALRVVGVSTLADRLELSRLAPGDVLIPRPCALRSEGPSITGPVVLAAPRAESGIGADLAPDGRLVVRRHHVAAPWDPPSEAMPMDQPPAAQSPESTLTSLEDVPVVVRVELGVVEMTAGAFAALEPGDVISLGRRVGDPATLRVAGVEVARGELVVVDGEVGVRILERTRTA